MWREVEERLIIFSIVQLANSQWVGLRKLANWGIENLLINHRKNLLYKLS